MSQEKIDAYKKEKSGRKERIAKQKKRNHIIKICSIVAGVAIIVAIAGLIVWNRVEASNAAAEAAAATEVTTDTTVEAGAATTDTETTAEDSAAEADSEAPAEDSANTEEASTEASAE